MSGPPETGLPKGWTNTTLGALCNAPQYGWTTSASEKDNGVRLLRSTDISSGSVNWETVPFCESVPPSVEKYQLHPGDIVITRTGAGVGNSLILEECPTSVFASYLIRFRPHPDVSGKFVAYFLKSPFYKSLVSLNSAGIAQPNVNATKLASLELPLAPRKEQDDIVAEIEKQFTRLDAAVAALKRVQANLKRYRAAVLKAACEGHLVPTEAELARRELRTYEPASALLELLRAERGSAKRVQPNLIISADHLMADLPELPDGWVWTTLDELLTSIEAGKSFKCEERPPNPEETGVVKVSAVTWGEFDENESKTCLEPERINEKYLITKGDFLFSRANTIQLVGACVIVKHINCRLMLSDKILRFKFLSVPREWMLWFLRSQFGRAEIERLSTGNQESMRNIGQDRIRSIRISLPPLIEIQRITSEIERRLSIIDEIQFQVDSGLRRAGRFRQSILRQAFEGKLVPQDRNDEPASALLGRIRAKREVEPKASPSRSRWKKEAQHVS